MTHPSQASSEFLNLMKPELPQFELTDELNSSLRRSRRQKSSDVSSSSRKFRKLKPTSLRLPRGVQRQSRSGAAYSGWVTVDGYRLLGPARPTAELASEDRRRLAEAKIMGGLPEARKVVQQLHAEVASSRRFKSQQLQYAMASRYSVSPIDRNLPPNVCSLSPCGSGDLWALKQDKLYASYCRRKDSNMDDGIHVMEFGPIRHTIEEAQRDAALANGDSTEEGPSDMDTSSPVRDADLVEIGNTSHKLPQQQEAVFGYCAVAEMRIENRNAYVGVCVFCEVVLVGGPARGSKSSAENDAFSLVGDVLSGGLSSIGDRHCVPETNPAEDLFLPPGGSSHSYSEVEGVSTPESIEHMKPEDVSYPCSIPDTPPPSARETVKLVD